MFRLFSKLDTVLVVTVALLLLVSLLVLYSLSAAGGTNFFLKQSIYAVIGMVVLFFTASLDYRYVQKYSTVLYFFTMGILLLVLLFGTTINGTAGWLSFGAFQVQPVEIAKVTLIIFLASFISKKKSELGEWTRVIASLILSAVLIFLVLRQPDLGSSLVLAAIWGGMIVASGLRLRHFLVLGFLGSLLIFGSWFLLADYQKARIQTFIHPESDPLGSGYNVLQAMVAVGSGGISGKGLGYGSQSQLSFLPEKQTDFIFAVVAEELGLVGAGFVIVLYGVLLYRIRRIGLLASDNFGYLLSLGVMIMVFVQVLINVGMNVGLLPVTGLPAPFLSYGGSSLLSLSASLGLLLSVYQRKKGADDMRLSLERSLL
ncbi:MAG: rod shape-determining protein RodA [Candidatus Moranbacteria bacterium]|nr:rod shape-determining protein RodA [Candidatus Moranbacteria bacterium]